MYFLEKKKPTINNVAIVGNNALSCNIISLASRLHLPVA